jgi:hypothetical protein
LTELIIPAGVKADYRPYRTATTEGLLYELQQRAIIAELRGEILMPPDLLDEGTRDAMRTQQFMAMAAQMGQQIAQAGWAVAFVNERPNLVDPEQNDEVLTLSLMLCRHPSAPQPQASQVDTPNLQVP